MPDKVLAFYIRLSSEDRDLKTNALKNESNSVFNQRRLLQDYYDTHDLNITISKYMSISKGQSHSMNGLEVYGKMKN